MKEKIKFSSEFSVCGMVGLKRNWNSVSWESISDLGLFIYFFSYSLFFGMEGKKRLKSWFFLFV